MRLIVNRFAFLLAALPLLWYGVVVIIFAQNFPYFDDYPAIVSWVERWSAPGANHWALLTEQHNFHRLVWLRLVLLVDLMLTGRIDFRALQYVGNLSVVLLAGLLWRQSPGEKNRGWVWLVAVWLLVQTQSWNNMFWSMAGLSNLYAPAFALLAFGGLTVPQGASADRLNGAFLLTLSAGLLATLTNGNGILVLPLLAAGFGLTGRFRRAGLTTVVAVAVLGWYFQDYHNPAKTPLAAVLNLANLGHLAQLWTTFLGATLYHPAVGWLAQLVGIASLVWTGWLLRLRYDRQRPALFWLLVFLQLTGLMLVLNRFEPDVAVMAASRYRNVSALLIATVWLTLADMVIIRNWLIENRLRLVYGLILFGSIGLNGISNVTYFTKIRQFRELKQTDQLLWQLGLPVHACAPQQDGAGQLRRLVNAGLFKLDALVMNELVTNPVIETMPIQAEKLIVGIDLNRTVGAYRLISGFAHFDGGRANFYTTRLAVRSRTGRGNWQIYSTLFHQRFEKQNSVLYRDSGFSALLPLTALPPDAEFGVVVRAGNRVGINHPISQ
jgi:hypothetical protein